MIHHKGRNTLKRYQFAHFKMKKKMPRTQPSISIISIKPLAFKQKDLW